MKLERAKLEKNKKRGAAYTEGVEGGGQSTGLLWGKEGAVGWNWAHVKQRTKKTTVWKSYNEINTL